MRSQSFLIKSISVFALAMLFAGSVFAQGKGKGGGGGGGRGGGPPGQQRQMGGGGGQGQVRQQPQPQQQPQQRQAGGGGGWQRQQMHVQRQQMQVQRQQQAPPQRQQQMQQWQNAQREQQMNARRQQMQQWQNTQREQQMNARRQQMQQWQNAQREQQMNARRQQRQQWQNTQREQQLNARRQQMQQWQNTQRQQQVNARRQQMQQWQNKQRQPRVNDRGEQTRVWQDSQRQQQRMNARRQQIQEWQQAQRQQREMMRGQPRQQRDFRQFERQQRVRVQPDANLGPVRRDFQYGDALQSQQGFDRNSWKFARKQQKLYNRAYQNTERDYYMALRTQEPVVGDVYRSRDWSYVPSVQPFYSNVQPYGQPYYYDYRTVNVFFGDDYSDYDRFGLYNVYTPVYTAYDYYNPDTLPIYRSYIYDEPFYGYDNGFDWKSLLFRSVIAAFFSNGDNVGYWDSYPRYTSYYDDRYYGYVPAYRYSEPYYTFGYTPSYTYYEPAAYYGYDQYSNYGVPYDYVGYPTFPHNDMVTLYSGGLGAELIQRALSTGYYQGLLEGQLARDVGWEDEHYQDPYLYEQTIYDPYSTSMGDCRRHFSEGYEMGYADGLRGQDEFYVDAGGDVDLVSLLIGSAISMRS